MMPTAARGARLLALVALAALPNALRAQATPAQARPLSLAEAIRLAESHSEAVEIARAGVQRASGQRMQARSAYLPQLGGTVSYARTLRSPFSALSGGGGTDSSTTPRPQAVCAPAIPANATPAEVQAALAQATTCQQAAGIDFSKVGFGAKNAWTVGLQLSQSVFSFGRNEGNNRAAGAQLRSAEIEVAAQRAQLLVDVTQAYYDATLADRLVTIADSSLSQTEEVLRQTRLARQVGNQSEFDLLRAQVTRDNQLPVSIQRRSDRQAAYLRLKQLLNLPLEDSLDLTTPVDSAVDGGAISAAAQAAPVAGVAADAAIDTVVSDRAPVRQLEQAVRAQEGLLRAARAEWFPAISLTSGYQRLWYPTNPFPTLADYRENWTIGASMSVSLFSGGRVRGGAMIAAANLAQTKAQLQQTREYAALDTRILLNQLAQAEATFAASRGTAEQAARAYTIDQVRYREGLSTQTDLSQSRLLLEQAVANRAVAARDLAVTRMKLALLRDLPIQLTSGASQQRATTQQVPQGSTQQQQQTQTQRQASATGATAGQIGGQTP